MTKQKQVSEVVKGRRIGIFSYTKSKYLTPVVRSLTRGTMTFEGANEDNDNGLDFFLENRKRNYYVMRTLANQLVDTTKSTELCLINNEDKFPDSVSWDIKKVRDDLFSFQSVPTARFLSSGLRADSEPDLGFGNPSTDDHLLWKLFIMDDEEDEEGA